MIPCYAIINKPTDNDFYTKIQQDYSSQILGEIPFDENIMNYDYASVHNETKNSARMIIEKIKHLKKRGNLSTIKNFQEMKSGK
jgi:CO dehydrogenase nickel-insertion accessory protein CooC1